MAYVRSRRVFFFGRDRKKSISEEIASLMHVRIIFVAVELFLKFYANLLILVGNSVLK